MSRLCATLSELIADELALHDAQRKVTRNAHPVFSVALVPRSEGPGRVAQDGDTPWFIVSDPRKKRALSQARIEKITILCRRTNQSLTKSPKYLKQVYDAGWLAS